MNSLLLFISLILTFSALILIKKYFGATGIIGFMGIATIFANILACKCINVFGLETTLGTIMFSSNYLATDILTECYDIKTARKGVYFSICSCIGFIIISQMVLLFTPSQSDIAQESLRTIFTLTPRITISSLIMFAISNFCDINLYDYMKKKMNNKYMWLRNNVCTILCNGLENFLFSFMAFGGLYDIATIISIAVVGTILEAIIALCDTPFLYIATALHKQEETYD